MVISTNRPTEVKAADMKPPIIPWAAEYESSTGSGNTLMTSLATPLDAPSSFIINASNVGDVYQNTGLPATVRHPVKSGVKVHAQVNETWTVTDDSNPAYRVCLPVQASITFKVPKHPLITDALVSGLVERALSALYDADGTLRVDSLLRLGTTPR